MNKKIILVRVIVIATAIEIVVIITMIMIVVLRSASKRTSIAPNTDNKNDNSVISIHPSTSTYNNSL